MKNIGVAGVLSVIFPGLGHIYLGKWIRGIIFIVLWLWVGIGLFLPKLIYYMSGAIEFSRLSLLLLLLFFVWIYNIISISKLINDLNETNNHHESKSL